MLALLALVALSSGCLPGLVSNAQTLKPGERSFAVAGFGRTHNLPANVAQGGTASGVIELRGGLPVEGADAALTLHMPWAASWDVRYCFLDEGRFQPATTAQLTLGSIQPSITGSLLATKRLGRVALTGLASIGRTNERLWRPGNTPFSELSESLVKDMVAWGGSLEVETSPIHRAFLSVITWHNSREKEAPSTKNGEFGVNEGQTWFFSAGLRLTWKGGPDRAPAGTLTALRGYIVKDPANNRFELGQPGLFRAAVLTDAFTRVMRDGRLAPERELKAGVAVLVQGIPLPQHSTFLARTIELQSPPDGDTPPESPVEIGPKPGTKGAR